MIYYRLLTESPVCAGVKGFWYPVPRDRVGGQNHTISFVADALWQVVLRGSDSSLARKGALQESRPEHPGTYSQKVPLAAIRSVGKGRIMFFGITPEYLFGAFANSTLEGIVLDKGLNGRPSDGFRLVTNSLRWLAEPTLASGACGGAKTEESLLRNPHKVRYSQPYSWPEKISFPQPETAWPGVARPRTRYSSGNVSADQWVEKAKAAGLSWVVFLEEFARLSKEDFEKLKADCARLSSAEFAAIPGFTIDDEVGNHYFYFGTSFPYPEAKFLTPDGKTFRSHDPEVDRKNPHVPGQLAMTTLDYAYSISSFRLTAGNYLFKQGAAPFADFFSDYDAMGVITARNGEVIEDASEDYLKLCASGQTPVPLVIDLMDDPAQLGRSRWRTVLSLPQHGGSIIGGALKAERKVRDYFDIWHTYPHNPVKPQVTSGPRIDTWSHVGPRDYEGSTRGDSVWHTLWRTEPVRAYSVNRRNHFFQVNPDSPLAVFLWQIDLALKADLPNQGFRLVSLQSRAAASWAFRSDAQSLRTGEWSGAATSAEPVSDRFRLNAYAAFLDSPLGGAALFPMTDGLAIETRLPGEGDVEVRLPADTAPQAKGGSKRVELLILGIPRRCTLTQDWPPSKDVVERFYREFGLDGGPGGYRVSLEEGQVLSRRYVFKVDGKASGALSGRLTGNLVSSLPICVCGLNDRWSAWLYDRGVKQSRPIGVLENQGWATVNLSGHADLFLGHPVAVDNAQLFVQLTQSGEQAWTLEVHNPTDAPITTRIRAHPAFDPLTGKSLPRGPVTVPAGESLIIKNNDRQSSPQSDSSPAPATTAEPVISPLPAGPTAVASEP